MPYGRNATRGKRRYKCQECGTMMFFSRVEESRAARLRCTACGSARLDVSKAGADRQTDTNDIIRDIGAKLDNDGTGSVVPK